MCARKVDETGPIGKPQEDKEPEERKEPARPSLIAKKYAALGGSSGFLGAPTIPEEGATPDGIGRYRHYEHGSIFWSPPTDVHEIHGYIGSKWAELGWERSFLGYPITDELAAPDGVGRYNLFQHGMIYWTPHQGAMPLAKPLRNISLVREQSKPEVYFLCGGVKLWIHNPTELTNVGFRWEDIQIVPDGALAAYRWHHFSAPATIKPSDVFFDCGENFDSITGRWHPNCQNSANLIRKDVVVAGWLVENPYVNNLPHGVEDIHYNIKLDPDFIDKMYGPNGLSAGLTTAVYPGNPAVADNQLPFRDLSPDGTERGVTYNSFIIARNAVDIHGELNAWHVDNTGGLWTRHFVGRGAAPDGWHHIPFENDPNVWWPFDILNPDSGASPLAVGDYLIMKGALWQDSPHEKPEEIIKDPWHRGVTRGHAGYTEIHPVDWVVRVDEPKPPVRKTVVRVCEQVEENSTKPFSLEIFPDFAASLPTKRYTVGEIRSLIDNRFTYLFSVSDYTVESKGDHVVVQGTINGSADGQGRFKACYIVTWRETDIRDVVWVEDALPAGAIEGGDWEGWSWLNDFNPAPFSGGFAHYSSSFVGMHQHFFHSATDQMTINTDDTLFTYVYLDPNDTPYEVMLQWNDGSWEHRAYWGANAIDWGQEGTTSRQYMGPMITAGEWVRLEVPAKLVGLEGKIVNGAAFTLFGGRAAWDRTGKCDRGNAPPPPPPTLEVSVTPYPVPVNRTVTVTVHAVDVATGANVAGEVKLGGTVIANTNTPFTHTFRGTRKHVGTHPPEWEVIYPTGTVTAPGYSETGIDFGFPDF